MAASMTSSAGLRLRQAVDTARRRMQVAGWPILQSAGAAGLAWFVASVLLGFDRPFYAPAAAVLCSGIAMSNRLRRPFEVAVGVAVGLLVADALVLVLGIGAPQLMVVVALAMTVALLLGSGVLLVNQAAISAILVVTVSPPTGGLTFTRFFHALIGGGSALLIGQVLFPTQPLPRVVRVARPVFDGLSRVLGSVAEALAAGDLAGAESALDDARALDPDVRRLRETLETSAELVRFTLVRRGAREPLSTQMSIVDQLDLAVRNTRVLARAAIALLRRTQEVPLEVPAAVGDLSAAVEALGSDFAAGDVNNEPRRLATQAATRVVGVIPDQPLLWTAVVVGHIRTTAVDVLRGSGLDLAAALDMLEEAEAQDERHDRDRPTD